AADAAEHAIARAADKACIHGVAPSYRYGPRGAAPVVSCPYDVRRRGLLRRSVWAAAAPSVGAPPHMLAGLPPRAPLDLSGGERTPPDPPRARGLAPGPQAGGQYRATADLLPRLIVGLEPWPSTVAFVRWLRPARSGVPTPLRRKASR